MPVVTPENAKLILPKDLTPAQITADQNDYDPAGWASAQVLRVDTDKLRAITGLRATREGDIRTIVNVGAQPLHLPHEHTGSAAANRLDLGSDLYLMPKECAILYRDAIASRWRPFSFGGLSRMIDPASRVIIHSDFHSQVNEWANVANGTGATAQAGTYGQDATNKAVGVWQWDTGTTATGRSAGTLGAGFAAPTLGVCIYAMRVAVEALSTAAEEYIVRCGAHDGSGGEPTDGVYFEYDRLTAGDFWRICAAGGSTRTKTTTAQAVTTDYIWLMSIANAAWTSVEYYARANGAALWTSLGSIADANVPTAAELIGLTHGIFKSAGTTQRNLSIDAHWFLYDYRR